MNQVGIFSSKQFGTNLSIFYNERGIGEGSEKDRGMALILQKQIDRINLFYNGKIKDVIIDFEEKYELIYQLTKKNKVQLNYRYLLEQQMLQYEILKDKITVLRGLEKKRIKYFIFTKK